MTILFFVEEAEVVEGVDVLRILVESLAIAVGRLVEPAELDVEVGEVAARLGRIGTNLESTGETIRRTGEIAFLGEDDAEVVEGVGFLRVDFQNPPIRVGGLVQPSGLLSANRLDHDFRGVHVCLSRVHFRSAYSEEA